MGNDINWDFVEVTCHGDLERTFIPKVHDPALKEFVKDDQQLSLSPDIYDMWVDKHGVVNVKIKPDEPFKFKKGISKKVG